ncbi:MAG: orotidine-5'-phosphate decarboxylase [Clostridiales bacterium]|jgi:orotidine-5'-phosphate decarboxylase|nr:orotidine-5'-phosphate decarboxylase [Clostridiales bacterium]
MRNFADSLVRRIDELENPTVVGLDTKLDYIPQHIKEYAESLFPEEPTKATAKAIWLFNKEIIDQTFDIVPAVKLQYAYYEMYGYDAIKTMLLTARYAQKKGMLVIGDCKRNDIGSTATAYAEAIIGKTDILLGDTMEMSGLDACTVNCYLGIDGVKPFIEVAKRDGKGIFCLVKTSNPSAGDFQDLDLADGRKLYEAVASKVAEWGEDLIGEEGFSSVGAVIGATYPEQAVGLRKVMPNAFILIPGYGAQGAGADEAVASFTAYGKGGIVNASRSIMNAWQARSDLFRPEDFGKAARFEAEDMKEKLNVALKNRKFV